MGKGDGVSQFHNVTIYVPCYNARQYIAEVVSAIYAQDYPIREVILVDDGSTDGSADLAQEVAVRKGRLLTIVRHAQNQGLACARNTAIKACKTEFLAGVDSDVSPDPNWLKTLMRQFDDDADLAGVGGCTIDKFVSAPGDRWRAGHMRLSHGDHMSANPPFLFGANHVFRNRILQEVGGYDVRQRRAGDDVTICAKLRSARYRFHYVPAARCVHLRRDTIWSALSTYWRWKYYGNWSDDHSTWRMLRAACGDCTTALFGLMADDLRRRDYRSLPIDLLYPMVSLRQHLSAYVASGCAG